MSYGVHGRIGMRGILRVGVGVFLFHNEIPLI
jgi:hypothetical protein